MAGGIYVDPYTFLTREDDQREIFRALVPKADSLLESMAPDREQAQEAIVAQMPPGVRAEMELIDDYGADSEKWRHAVPPQPPVTVLLGFAIMPGPPPPFPEGVEAIDFFRAERELTLRRFEEWLDGHPNGSVQVLPETGHLVPNESPEAIVEAVDAILQILNEEPGSPG